MRIASNVIGLALFTLPYGLGSCNNLEPSEASIEHVPPNVELEAPAEMDQGKDEYTSSILECDGILYTLEIVADQLDTIYYWDDHAQNIVRLSTVYEVADTFFCGQDSYIKAAAYCKSTYPCNNIKSRTSIQVLNAVKVFEETWFISDQAFTTMMNGITTYAFIDASVSVEDGFIYYNGKATECIRIIYTLKGFDGGFTKFILNFVKEEKRAWKLASRERINTMRNDPAHEPWGYCTDTSRYWNDFSETEGGIMINHEMLFQFGHTKCN